MLPLEAAFGYSRLHKLVKDKRAFSLVEMLVVVAIMGILAVLGVSALGGLQQSATVNQAVSGISLLLGQARSYAMAHDTYVWVGFAPNTTSQKLTVGVVAGITGQPTDINSATTYAPIAVPKSYSNFNLTTIPTVKAANPALTGIWPSGIELTTSALTSFTMSGGGTTTTFTSTSPSGIVQFDPEGEANVSATGALPHWIQFGLQPSRGANNPNVAVIQIAGLSGQVQVFRP